LQGKHILLFNNYLLEISFISKSPTIQQLLTWNIGIVWILLLLFSNCLLEISCNCISIMKHLFFNC
jgi:hypothetical protein